MTKITTPDDLCDTEEAPGGEPDERIPLSAPAPLQVEVSLRTEIATEEKAAKAKNAARIREQKARAAAEAARREREEDAPAAKYPQPAPPTHLDLHHAGCAFAALTDPGGVHHSPYGTVAFKVDDRTVDLCMNSGTGGHHRYRVRFPERIQIESAVDL